MGKYASLERQTHIVLQSKLQFEKWASTMYEIRFEVTKSDLRMLRIFSFPPKEEEKKKDQLTRFLGNHSIWLTYFPFILTFTKKLLIFYSDFFFLFIRKKSYCSGQILYLTFWEINPSFVSSVYFAFTWKCIVLRCRERGGSQVMKMFYYCH